jgi:hypothetical protein
MEPNFIFLDDCLEHPDKTDSYLEDKGCGIQEFGLWLQFDVKAAFYEKCMADRDSIPTLPFTTWVTLVPLKKFSGFHSIQKDWSKHHIFNGIHIHCFFLFSPNTNPHKQVGKALLTFLGGTHAEPALFTHRQVSDLHQLQPL